MFLLDTNVISELRKADKANPHVVDWAKKITPSKMFVSVISIMELRMGILSLARKDTRQADVLSRWLDTLVLPTFSGRILSVDLAVANQCAALHVPDPRSDRDALIAATAIVHGFTVVTRNTKDFRETGVSLINPWNAI
ncbi:type II toxin-antitoxin system VapC family toxin [Mailhella massiliensis]|uniref:type II toxin-antitoxin system VapC family toxin n=1 Tax=Mailhella massiliensis TaxID=1903261 RepID=UPI002356DEAD|nr:type II toxin-antitoxin system VapC family toxin [Mailhella massiliensis]